LSVTRFFFFFLRRHYERGKGKGKKEENRAEVHKLIRVVISFSTFLGEDGRKGEERGEEEEKKRSGVLQMKSILRKGQEEKKKKGRVSCPQIPGRTRRKKRVGMGALPSLYILLPFIESM